MSDRPRFDDAPDPDLARVVWERVRDAGTSIDDPALIRLLGFSRAAADFLVRHPDEAASIAHPVARDRPALDAELGAGPLVRAAGLPLQWRIPVRSAGATPEEGSG